jgi:hypothetical protein
MSVDRAAVAMAWFTPRLARCYLCHHLRRHRFRLLVPACLAGLDRYQRSASDRRSRLAIG